MKREREGRKEGGGREKEKRKVGGGWKERRERGRQREVEPHITDSSEKALAQSKRSLLAKTVPHWAEMVHTLCLCCAQSAARSSLAGAWSPHRHSSVF